MGTTIAMTVIKTMFVMVIKAIPVILDIRLMEMYVNHVLKLSILRVLEDIINVLIVVQTMFAMVKNSIHVIKDISQ